MGREPILRISRLRKNFGKNKILKDISFDVYDGEILGLIGASGSGKTTMLRTISGYYLPDMGDVQFRYDTFFKKNLQGKPIFRSIFSYPKIFKNLFGFASQDPSFYEKLTAAENLQYFGSLYNLNMKALKSNAEVLLALMDLKQARKTLGGKLSGGMERRLDIACALIHDPEILILDEPTSDLDPVLRDHIWSLVQKINKRGTTIILASHHLSEVENFCSRIAILKDGRLVELDTPSRLKSRHADAQEIVLQSYPGDYDNLVKALKKPGGKAFDVKIRGSELVVYSNDPKIVLHEIIHALDLLKEEIVDIKVSRPGLDELFLKISEKDNREK
jgi:ABC-2 type transport system ATP-binding protein